MRTLITNVTMVNEGVYFNGCLLINDLYIEKIFQEPEALENARLFSPEPDVTVDGTGLILIPGVIDDQVHFREPGQPAKGSIEQESRAALLGGVTSFMDMPNNNPPAITAALLKEKYSRAARTSYINYGFYLGATNGNAGEVTASPPTGCGLKIFMGSSTGNMLVDDPIALETFFRDYKGIIATHCEEETIIRHNLQQAKEQYGEHIPVEMHPIIRSREACIASTRKAIELATRFGTRLHILHISTKEEVALIQEAAIRNPQITGEVCVHHLWFSDGDYTKMGNLIKCNPAIKTMEDREALRQAVAKGIIGVIGSDHAPHTLEEKQAPYLNAPSGLPLVQHSLQMMLELYDKGLFTLPRIVEGLCHGPARVFGLSRRGFLKEGYFADLVLIDPAHGMTVTKESLAYTCGWSPLEGHTFSNTIRSVYINGQLAAENSRISRKPHPLPVS